MYLTYSVKFQDLPGLHQKRTEICVQLSPNRLHYLNTLMWLYPKWPPAVAMHFSVWSYI